MTILQLIYNQLITLNIITLVVLQLQPIKSILKSKNSQKNIQFKSLSNQLSLQNNKFLFRIPIPNMIPSLDKKVDLIKQQKHLFQKIFSKKDNTWKIIIFDQPNHDIISSLFKLKDFRQNNITLYFNINEKNVQREQLHGVTAIYLIKPNQQNIEQIIKDFERDLYSSVVVHFSCQPAAHLLANFAKNLSKRKSSAVSKIQKIQYSNAGFQCIDKKMAVLPDLNQIINLLRVFKNQPIFIHGYTENDLVHNLKQRLLGSTFDLKNNQSQENSISNLKKIKKYTKVLIFNRQNDMFPIVGHGITYACLLQDIWKLNSSGNKIIDKQRKAHQVDLNDLIWLEKKNMLISQMRLIEQCNKIKSKLISVNNKMQQYTDLTDKNKKIQWHLNNSQLFLTEAKKRRLNQFHAVQQDLHIKRMLTGQNKKQFVQLLRDPQNQKNDKIRLMLSYIICVDNYDQNQVQELQGTFLQIKNNKYYNEVKKKKMQSQSQQNANSKYIKKLAKGLWKNLLNSQKKYLLIKYLQKTKDLSQKNIHQLGLKMTSLRQIPLNAQIQHSLVYCIGGINFNQYSNLSQYDPSVLYTGDRIINYRQFMQ